MDYRFDGKRKTLSLGVYPAVSLASARQKRDEHADYYETVLIQAGTVKKQKPCVKNWLQTALRLWRGNG